MLVAATGCALVAACQPNWQSMVPYSRSDRMNVRCGGGVTVVSGDTVFGVARRCNVSVRELIEANGLRPPYIVRPGDFLRMPGGGFEHIVRRGDTLSGVARQYRVDFQTLARSNGKSPPYTIYVGERLRVPGSYVVASRPSPAPAPDSRRVVVTSPQTEPAGNPSASAPSRDDRPAPAQTHPAFQRQSPLPPDPPPMAGKGFSWPVRGELVARFGPVAKGQHNDGINISAAKGTPIAAAENGVVAYAGNELKGFGNLVLLKHDGGWMTAYAHADQLLVSKGQTVRRGDRIATVGESGNVTEPQLHFEIRKGTEAVDPLDHLGGGAVSGAEGEGQLAYYSLISSPSSP